MSDQADPVSEGTPPTRFQHGARVRLTPDHPWAAGATGTLASFPHDVRELIGSKAPTPAKLQELFSGPDPESNVSYWVVFDEAVVDDEGYSLEACEIPSANLESEDIRGDS